MQDIKNKIEAVLFTTGRLVDLDELSQLTGIASKGTLSDALRALIEDYKNKEGSLEIVGDGEKFKLNIKKDYLYLTTQLLDQTEFDKEKKALQEELLNRKRIKAFNSWLAQVKENSDIELQEGLFE